MADEMTVREEDGELVVTLPKGAAYAAIALRLDVDSEESAVGKLMELSDHLGAFLERDDTISVLQGAEALAAVDYAARQWAESLGLNYQQRRVEPDPDELGDHLRRCSAGRAGIPQESLLRWEQLQHSEQAQWLGHAWAAVDYFGEEA